MRPFQTVRGAETVPRSSRGFDARKRANGRKRHIVTDTCGWLPAVLVTGAGVQDRDAGHLLPWISRTVFTTIRLVWADGGYAGKLVDYATTMLGITVQIVSSAWRIPIHRTADRSPGGAKPTAAAISVAMCCHSWSVRIGSAGGCGSSSARPAGAAVCGRSGRVVRAVRSAVPTMAGRCGWAIVAGRRGCRRWRRPTRRRRGGCRAGRRVRCPGRDRTGSAAAREARQAGPVRGPSESG
jgi:Transposase DDE domain